MTISNDEDEMKLSQVEDRLSNLPVDILLFDIMERLPLRSAIVMSSLSKSWQGLWAFMRCIDLNTIPVDNTNTQFRSSEFWYTIKCMFDFADPSHRCRRWGFDSINKVILQIKSPIIQRFDIRLPCFCDIKVQSLNSYLDSWLSQVCERGVEEVRIEPGFRISSRPRVIPTLPSCLLQSISLTFLELGLDCNFYYHLPPIHHGQGFGLPKVQKLRLSVQFTDDASVNNLSNLFSSCPSLKDLSLAYGTIYRDRTTTSPILNISNPNLKRLCLLSIDSSNGELPEVAVDATTLQHFEHDRLDLNVSFSKTPKDLIDVKIQSTNEPNSLRFGALLNGISSAESLRLSNWFPGGWSPPLYALRIFPNLTTLQLIAWRGQLDIVPLLLQRCPSLTLLSLYAWCATSFDWNSMAQKLNCLNTKLKHIYILTDYPEIFLDFIQDFLCNAHELPYLELEVGVPDNEEVNNRVKLVQEKLSECAEAALPHCNITFSTTNYSFERNSNTRISKRELIRWSIRPCSLQLNFAELN